MIKKLTVKFYKSPILFTIAISFCISLLYSIITNISHNYAINNIFQESLLYSLFALPIILTIENLIFFVLNPKLDNNSFAHKKLEVFGLCLGLFASILAFSIEEIKFSDWNIQLSNGQVHSPILLEAIPTLMIILLISFIGYIYCRFIN